MKYIFLFIATLSFSVPLLAERPIKVKAKNYTCSELNELIIEHGTVHVAGFGSLDVHSSPNKCNVRRGGSWQEAYQTSWRTSDKWFCIAGYSCRNSTRGDDH